MFQNIECPECKRFPFFDINFENNDCLIKCKCHNKKFKEISLNKFMNFCNPSKCKECKIKNIKYICYCGLFCEDDYLYHILTSKHNRINDYQKIIKLNKTFKYYCFDCNQIFNEEHQNHYYLTYEQFIIYLNNYVIFIFEEIKKMKYINEEITQILILITYVSINNIEQGYYEYYLNLQNLVISMIYFKNNDIDNKKGNLNYIISNYSIKQNSNETIINKESKIREEFYEIYLNKKKIKFEYEFDKEENRILLLFHKLLISTKNMFSGCSSLTSLNLSNFNTNNVKDMSCMFNECSSLISLNLHNFNTNNVKDMSYMFSWCSSLTSLNLENFNTNNVNNMSFMFFCCSSLTSLNLSYFNTNNVEDMSCMFCGCSSLTSLNLSNFNTNNVNDMNCMFYNCSSLISLKLSNFNTNNVNCMRHMFSGINHNCTIETNDKKILNKRNKVKKLIKQIK